VTRSNKEGVDSMVEKRQRRSKNWIDEPGLAQLLLLVRQFQGWSQRDLADRAGLDGSSIARIEAHERRPTPQTVAALAQGLGMEPEEVLRLARRLTDPNDPVAAEEIAHLVASQTEPRRLARQDRSPVTRAEPEPPEALPLTQAPSSAVPAREFVAAAPVGALRWVFRQEVGRDEAGGFWINPAARALPHSLDHKDVRFTRQDDGTFVIDPSRLDKDNEIGPRDPTRHNTRARIAESVSSVEQVMHDAYTATVLEVELPERGRITVEPRPPGITEGEFPKGVERIHVITAANPHSRPLTAGENEERNRYLRRDLDAAGWRYTAALGRAPEDDGWQESSFAVFDGDETRLLEIARAHEQHAIFRWTPTERSVLYTDQEAGHHHGWSSDVTA
jgi:transcriptional regulator with XRE-family HTH domain